MSYGRISERAEVYARTLFELTSKEETLKHIQTIERALADSQVEDFLKSPLVSRKEKKEILKSVLKEVPDLERNFIFLLADRGVTDLLGEIGDMFRQLLNDKLSCVQGEVISSHPISSEEKASLEKGLEKHLKKKVSLEEKVSSKHIGGLYVKVGDFVFNDTLDFHLKTFQNTGG